MNRVKLVTALAAGLIASTSAFAGAVISVYGGTWTGSQGGPAGYYKQAYIGFEINFLGNNYSRFDIYDNGTVVFGLDNYGVARTFSSLTSSANSASSVIISPFFFDAYDYTQHSVVRSLYNDPSYSRLTYDGNTAFAITWAGTVNDPNNPAGTAHNRYQLLLVDRSDTGVGNFDFIFNFDFIQLDNKDFGDSSFFGYAAEGNFYGYTTDNNHLLTLNSSQLPYNSINSDVAGRYVFEVRDGVVTNPLPFLTAAVVPEPETWAMMLAGLGLVAGVARRRQVNR
jgi:hypothetical protein